MSYCLYEVDKATRVATLTFNRPEKLHAYTSAHMHEMIDVLSEAETDDNVAAIILRGSGRAFGGGYDIDEVRNARGFQETSRRPSLRQRLAELKHHAWGDRGLIQKILTCDKATIAQVHGYCYGGHFEIMSVCDYAIASEDAVFTHPGWRYLGIEGHLMVYILTYGWRRTKEMMLLGKELTAQEALEWGMINKMVPRDKLEKEARKIAERIAKNPIDGIVAGKAVFHLALDIMRVGAGEDAASIGHALMSNLRFEPGEFNLMKELASKGRQGMYAERSKRYGEYEGQARGPAKSQRSANPKP